MPMNHVFLRLDKNSPRRRVRDWNREAAHPAQSAGWAASVSARDQ
eukprot:gene25818-biopygen8954